MESVESQIAEWRTFVAGAPAVNGHDVDELEDHLRDQIAELNAAGLTNDEAFLVAVKRMGDVDAVSREFAREHSDRLWKQLLGPGEDASPAPSGWVEALIFALAAAAVIEVARLAAGFPDKSPTWFGRNLSLFVLPFLAGYFARRRQLDTRAWIFAAAPFVFAALLINLYPYDANSDTEILVALHLPVILWFAISFPYMGGTLRSHERRMDFVRFTGEWFIYYVLDRARWSSADGPDRGNLQPRGRRCRPGRSLGPARRRRGWSDRRRVARRVEAAGRGEHGAGADDALHAAVRVHAGLRDSRLRRDGTRRRVRPRPPQRLRRPVVGRPRARPVRAVGTGSVDNAELDGSNPAGRRQQRPRARPDGARFDDRPDRRRRVQPEPDGGTRPQRRPARQPRGRGLALRCDSSRDAARSTVSSGGRRATSRSSPSGRRRLSSSCRRCSASPRSPPRVPAATRPTSRARRRRRRADPRRDWARR